MIDSKNCPYCKQQTSYKMDTVKLIDEEIDFHYKQIKRHKSRINQLIVLKQELTNIELDSKKVPRGTSKIIDYSEAIEIIKYISGKRIGVGLTEREYQATKLRKEMVHARLEEGSNIKEAKAVIDDRFRKWLDSPYEGYLKVETIFRPSKYQKYVDELEEDKMKNVKRNLDCDNLRGEF